jgi:hypothetical protein
MLTIDSESRQRANLPTDIDFMEDRYKTINGHYSFPSPSLWTIEKNLFYLLKNADEVTLQRQYYMRPSYLSYDQYNTVALAYLLMYVNQVQCVEDFTIDTVVIPTFSAIIDICIDKFPGRDRTDLQQIRW